MRIFTYVGAVILVLLVFNIVFLPARRDQAENLANQAVAEHQMLFKSEELMREKRLYWLNKLDLCQAFVSDKQSVWQCYDRATHELRWEKTITGRILVFKQPETILELTKDSSGVFYDKIQRIDLQTGKVVWKQPLKIKSKSGPLVDLSQSITLVIEKEPNTSKVAEKDTFLRRIRSMYDTEIGVALFEEEIDTSLTNEIPLKTIPFSQIPAISAGIAYFPHFNLFYNPNDTTPFFLVENGAILDTEKFWVIKEEGSSAKTRITTLPKIPDYGQSEFIAIDTKSGLVRVVEDRLYVSEFVSFKNKSSYRRHQLYPLHAIRSSNHESYQGLPIYSYNYGNVDLDGKRKWMFSQKNELVQIKEMRGSTKLKKLKIPNSRKAILKIIEEDGFFYFYIREKYPTEYDPTIITQKYKLPINFESE